MARVSLCKLVGPEALLLVCPAASFYERAAAREVGGANRGVIPRQQAPSIKPAELGTELLSHRWSQHRMGLCVGRHLGHRLEEIFCAKVTSTCPAQDGAT